MMTPEATNASTTSTSAEEPVAVEIRHITKTLPGVVADNDVSLIVRRGSIHVLVGENDTGTSTLMNVLYGLLKAEPAGNIINANPVHISGPRDAIAPAIGMVHQHFT